MNQKHKFLDYKKKKLYQLVGKKIFQPSVTKSKINKIKETSKVKNFKRKKYFFLSTHLKVHTFKFDKISKHFSLYKLCPASKYVYLKVKKKISTSSLVIIKIKKPPLIRHGNTEIKIINSFWKIALQFILVEMKSFHK